jgi:hypothetical protein
VNGDLGLRVFPPAVADSAATARAASQAALEAHGLVGGQQGRAPSFGPTVAAAVSRFVVAWAAELDRLATVLTALGDQADQSVIDYEHTDRLAAAAVPSP